VQDRSKDCLAFPVTPSTIFNAPIASWGKENANPRLQIPANVLVPARSPSVGGRRYVNEATIPDVYPLPLIQQTINELGSSIYYSCLAPTSSYVCSKNTSKIPQFARSICRTHLLNNVFCPVLGKGVVIYIDDVLVHTSTLEDL
jgi:hypothetical protein